MFDEPLGSFSKIVPDHNHPNDPLIGADQTWSILDNGNGDLDLMLPDSNNLNSGFVLADHQHLDWSSTFHGNDDLDSGSMVPGNDYLNLDVMVSSDDDQDFYFSPFDDVSSVFLAGENSCDASTVGDSMLFGKVRRGESCRAPPVGQAPREEENQSQGLKEDDLLNPSNIEKTIRALFPKDFNKCQRQSFPMAHIPVCKDESLVHHIIPDGLGSFFLVDVSFGTSLHAPFFFLFTRDSQQLLIDFAKRLRDCVLHRKLFGVAIIFFGT